MFNFLRKKNSRKDQVKTADDKVVLDKLPRVHKFINLFSQPEFLSDPAAVILSTFATEAGFMTFFENQTNEQSLKAIPIFTEEWLQTDFIARYFQESVKTISYPYTGSGFINAISMFTGMQISHYVINPCPDCKVETFIPLSSLKSPGDLQQTLVIEKAVRMTTLLDGLEKAFTFLKEQEFQKAGGILAELEKHNRLILPELYHAFFLSFVGAGMEEGLIAVCQKLMDYDYCWGSDLLTWWNSLLKSGYITYGNIPAGKNPFNLDLVDCRPVALGATYLEDDEIMGRYASRQYPDLEAVVHKEIKSPFKMPCNLVYPLISGDIPDGMIFAAPSIYFRWHIYHSGGMIYFIDARSDELQLRFHVKTTGKDIIADEIEASGERFQPDHPFVIGFADFCIKRHIYQLVAPHPVPLENPKVEDVWKFSLSFYGCAGLFAALTDTTQISVAQLITEQKISSQH